VLSIVIIGDKTVTITQTTGIYRTAPKNQNQYSMSTQHSGDDNF